MLEKYSKYKKKYPTRAMLHTIGDIVGYQASKKKCNQIRNNICRWKKNQISSLCLFSIICCSIRKPNKSFLALNTKYKYSGSPVAITAPQIVKLCLFYMMHL